MGWVSSVGDISSEIEPSAVTRQMVKSSPIRCPEPTITAAMAEAIAAAKRDGDTLGGCVSVTARGVPSGWGAPVFDKLEADLAKKCLSLPACKGFEIGSRVCGHADERQRTQWRFCGERRGGHNQQQSRRGHVGWYHHRSSHQYPMRV